MPTSGVVQRSPLEVVVRDWWGELACRANVTRLLTTDCKLGRLIQWEHGPTCVATDQKLQTAEKDESGVSLNATEVLMLHTKLKIIPKRASQANKAALEVEKARTELYNQIEQIEQWLHPKRAHTDGDSGDAHEKLTEVDNWDLRVHRREATRV